MERGGDDSDGQAYGILACGLLALLFIVLGCGSRICRKCKACMQNRELDKVFGDDKLGESYRPRRFEDDFALGIHQARVSMVRKKSVAIKARRTTAVQPMQKSQAGVVCSICALEFEPGESVRMLACHRSHMLHDECFDQLKKFAEKQKSKMTCPICRIEIDIKKVVKKTLISADTEIGVHDPFSIKGKQTGE